jgi:sulfite reductase beta subunit-like hemoprotein
LTPDDGLELRGVALEATPEVLEALPPVAEEAESIPGHMPWRMEVAVTPPDGALTSAQLERLAAIAEAYAFGGLRSAAGGRLVVWGLDPTLVTEVIAEAQAAGLPAAPARRAGD